MSATANNTLSENDLEAGKFYTIKRRGQFVASGKFTGKYAPGGLIGTSPIFEIGDEGEKSFARGRYSYNREIAGGSRRTRRRGSSRRSTRRQKFRK